MYVYFGLINRLRERESERGGGGWSREIDG